MRVPRPKRRSSRKTLRNKADRLFSEAIRSRDGHCRNCGRHWGLQCAHLISRRYNAVRWSLDNAVCLCQRCHMKFTHDPVGWEAWIDERFGPRRLKGLKARAKQGVAKVDLEAVVKMLSEGE